MGIHLPSHGNDDRSASVSLALSAQRESRRASETLALQSSPHSKFSLSIPLQISDSSKLTGHILLAVRHFGFVQILRSTALDASFSSRFRPSLVRVRAVG